MQSGQRALSPEGSQGAGSRLIPCGPKVLLRVGRMRVTECAAREAARSRPLCALTAALIEFRGNCSFRQGTSSAAPGMAVELKRAGPGISSAEWVAHEDAQRKRGAPPCSRGTGHVPAPRARLRNRPPDACAKRASGCRAERGRAGTLSRCGADPHGPGARRALSCLFFNDPYFFSSTIQNIKDRDKQIGKENSSAIT